ncbi:MAG: SRPBCC domain-containing protein [Sphingopyxis sp.]|uniref:SRPBCC family protein n=1 Tax=Sphingopyxis sp. TaxID=1908224 RepID=UPI001A1A54E9|nr:SRPBCC domain-containing protein [Sphingopyxis sp.]MBJ7499452.1 SRPBCC domain-containing protein [Sphingopyxis sp.]
MQNRTSDRYCDGPPLSLAIAQAGRRDRLHFVNHYTAAFATLAAALASPGTAEPVRVTTHVEADRSQTMVHEAIVDGAIADVWTAISTPEGWMSWAVPRAWISPVDADVLETSYDSTERPGDPGTIQQRFIARIPSRLLVFRTIKAPEGFPHWETYRRVTSVFELEPAGRQTRVRLTSLGYPDTDAGNALVGFFGNGNAKTLENLQRRFLTGPVDWNKP